MEKIKIGTVSGSSLEKPLVTAFRGTAGIYVVLDNEVNGTMGLPIILVSKLENGKLVLINDTEWNTVKEMLRLIISGNQVDYVAVDESLVADDMFFRQLTLPVASFDALKNNYKVMDGSTPVVESTPEVISSTQMENTPVTASPEVITPAVETPAAPVTPEVVSTPVAPAVPTPEVVQMPAEPVTPAVEPVIPSVPVGNPAVETPAPPVVETPVVPGGSPVVETPVVPTVEEVPVAPSVPTDFTADKEAFLKACENMFDALVAKFK